MRTGRILAVAAMGIVSLSTALAGCGGNSKEHRHDWGEWNVTAPSCETAGERSRVCKKDPSHIETEPIAATGHDWSTAWDFDVNAHYHVCNNGCGKRKDEAEHSISDAKCDVCGYTLTPSDLRYEEVYGEDGSTVTGYSVVGWNTGVTDRTRLVIPAEHEDKPVVSVADNAFNADDGDGDETLAFVYLPESVADLGQYAFYGCSGLQSVNLGNVRNIYQGAFYNCTGLKKAEAGSLGTLGAYAFYHCAALEEVSVEGIENFEEEAFRDCPSLERVKFGDGVEALARHTFYDSEGIKYISFGSAFSQEISESGFFPDALETIEVSQDNATYSSEGGILYNKGKTEIVYVPRSVKGKVVIADGVTEIGASRRLFQDHDNITSLTIPASVTNIVGRSTAKSFEDCRCLFEIYNLTEIDLRKEVARSNAYGLEDDVVIHSSLSEPSVVGDEDGEGFVWSTDNLLIAAFRDRAELTLPASHGGNPYAIRKAVFSHSSVEKLTIPSGVTSIGEEAFARCENLSEVTIGEGLTEIGVSAFTRCTALEKIGVPKSVKTVGAGAFLNCDALQRINYAGTVSEWAAIEFGNNYASVFETSTSGGQATLYLGDGNPLPERIVIEGIEKIGNYAFYKAPVKEIVLGEGIREIGQCAFYQTSIGTIAIGAGVTKIGERAFGSCAELKSVVLGKDVGYFRFAFSGSPVENVYYEGTEELWAALNLGNGGGGDIGSGGSGVFSADVKVYLYAAENPGSGNAWHYGADGAVEEWETASGSSL